MTTDKKVLAQTAQADYYPGAFISGHINHPAIPAHALDMDTELKDSIDLMGREEAPIAIPILLNAVYAAYALGQKMATPDAPVLPTVNLPLVAVTDHDHAGQRTELEVVQDALARYMLLPVCTEGEHRMLYDMLEGLRMDTADLIARLFSQTLTKGGAAK